MARQSKDLFDDSTMTFGEHLEALRMHLFKSILGLIVAVIVCLIYGEEIVAFVREPIDSALAQYTTDQRNKKIDVQDDATLKEGEWYDGLVNLWNDAIRWVTGGAEPPPPAAEATPPKPLPSDTLQVAVSAFELLTELHAAMPQTHPAPPESARDTTLNLTLKAPEFAQFQAVARQTLEAVTFNVQEAFMTYLKVSLVAAVVLASPWIFYQLWLFVAAGLYQHERKFVYIYGSMSLVLFLAGAAFCFYAVFPLVLKFLLEFNARIGVTPQIRLSEWISFAVVLPLMFGISFQLPLVMKFLTALSIFSVAIYREKRRLAILAIAFISMVLTPADPFSMLLMMFPLLLLYELGILLCDYSGSRNPFVGAES
ncbi:MAG: twin-arginine translocase subunit TatC [Planctomycetaceae bacterium]